MPSQSQLSNIIYRIRNSMASSYWAQFGIKINMVLTNKTAQHFAKKKKKNDRFCSKLAPQFVTPSPKPSLKLTRKHIEAHSGRSPLGENTHINPPINLKIMMATTDWLVAHSTLKVASSRKPYTSSCFRPYVSDRKPHRKAEVIIPAGGKETEEEMVKTEERFWGTLCLFSGCINLSGRFLELVQSD